MLFILLSFLTATKAKIRRTLLSSLITGLLTSAIAPGTGASARMPFQSTAVLQGRVVDQNRAVVPGAQVSVQNSATGLARKGETDSEGNYQIAALPVGNHRVEVRARGFRTEIIEQLRIEVARRVVQDFRLEVGDIAQTINVTPEAGLIELATVSVGQVVDQRTVQELPCSVVLLRLILSRAAAQHLLFF